MESVSVLVATTSQSLATFIKQELAETTVTVHVLTDPEQFFKKLKITNPGLILLDATYPTREQTADLVGKLGQKSSWKEIPLVIIKTFFEPLDEALQEIAADHILTQPFTRADLLTVLQQASEQPIINHRPDDEEEVMTESTSTINNAKIAGDYAEIIELTEVVEEGVPLDQLEPLAEIATSPASASQTDDQTGEVPETAAVIADEVDFDFDFSGDDLLDELELLPDAHPGEKTEPVVETADQPEIAAGDTMDTLEELNPDLGATTTTAEPLPDAAAEPLAAADEEAFIDFTEDLPAAEPAASAVSAPEPSPTDETPEDYLLPGEEESFAPGTADQSGFTEEGDFFEAAQSISEPPPATPEPAAEPSVVTESPEQDFSSQIEGLTQEWSRKMLVSTYASMDKLIQALGDMAPTIVEQVAKEIIPPLAEKIIKAEIQRLEKKIEDETT